MADGGPKKRKASDAPDSPSSSKRSRTEATDDADTSEEFIVAIEQRLAVVEAEREELRARLAALDKERKELKETLARLRSRASSAAASSSSSSSNADAKKPEDVSLWSSTDFKWSKEIEEKLKTVFGLESFRPNQREAINATMAVSGGEWFVVLFYASSNCDFR